MKTAEVTRRPPTTVEAARRLPASWMAFRSMLAALVVLAGALALRANGYSVTVFGIRLGGQGDAAVSGGWRGMPRASARLAMPSAVRHRTSARERR